MSSFGKWLEWDEKEISRVADELRKERADEEARRNRDFAELRKRREEKQRQGEKF